MKILYIGAGVIGSITAAKLARSGHDVTVLARGKRLEQVRRAGLVIRNGVSGEVADARVETVEALGKDDQYDLAVVPVRADHLPDILPVLAANTAIPDILIMVNNPKGYERIVKSLGKERFLLGFPGMGGGIVDGVVEYSIANPMLQPTTFGEIDGRNTERLASIADMFRDAGFPVAIEKNMDAWQKTHICWIMPFAAAIYMAGGSSYQLAERPDALARMIDTIRECFAALKEMGIPVTPPKLKVFEWLPRRLLVKIMQMQCRTREMELLASLHCQNAPGEMRRLADDLMELVERSGIGTPALTSLMHHVPCGE